MTGNDLGAIMTDQEMSDALDVWEKKKESFSVPQNDIERVRLHYEGVAVWSNKHLTVTKILSLFMFPITILLFLRRKQIPFQKQVDVVITCPNKSFLLKNEDIPDQLTERYASFEHVFEDRPLKNRIFQLHLDKKGIALALRIAFKYPFKPLIYYSVLLHLAQVYTIIQKYGPKAIITTQTEQDFSSSVVTQYCEMMGVKYICVQHGEYCYNPSMAYVRFSEYYAWNKETVEILELTNTKIPYANIYTPSRLRKTCQKNPERSYFLKYYLSSSDDMEEIGKIRDALAKFTSQGFACAVRCHPRGYTGRDLEKVFSNTGIAVEESRDKSIVASISDCDYVVAYRSTVLSEAIANEMPIVIDDITHDIKILQRVHDINLSRAYCLLSELMDRVLR